MDPEFAMRRSGHACPAPGTFGWAPLLLLLTLLAMPALAAANPFGMPPSTEAQELTLVDRASAWILQTQRDLHRRLTLVLHQLDEAPTARTAAALILASFLYGIFHAAGPGHGKAIISTYLLTHRQSLARGIWLSTLSSLMQGVTAIVAVLLLIGILGWLARDTMGQVRNLEMASFLLVALLGLWLIGRGLRSIWRLWRETPARTGAVDADGPLAAPTFSRVPDSANLPRARDLRLGHAETHADTSMTARLRLRHAPPRGPEPARALVRDRLRRGHPSLLGCGSGHGSVVSARDLAGRYRGGAGDVAGYRDHGLRARDPGGAGA
jgi:ABC-type nickel/cobalt efflux system permease component RcnA